MHITHVVCSIGFNSMSSASSTVDALATNAWSTNGIYFQHQTLKMLLLQLLLLIRHLLLLLQLLGVLFVALDSPAKLHDSPGQLLADNLSNSRAQGTHETRFMGDLYVEANKLCIQSFEHESEWLLA